MDIFSNSFVSMKLVGKILYITVQKEFCKWEELAGVKEACTIIFDQCIKQRKKIAIIIDARKMGILPLSYITDWTNYLIGKRPITIQIVTSYSIVLSNSILKSIINRVLTLNPGPVPTEFFTTMEPGELFANLHNKKN